MTCGRLDHERKRWGTGRVQLQHVAGAPNGCQQLLLVRSLDLVVQRHLTAARIEIEVDVQIDTQVFGQKGALAAINLQQSDGGRCAGIRSVFPKRPRAAPVLLHLQAKDRGSKREPGDDDLFGQQRPEPDVELSAIGLDEVRIASPCRIGELNAVEFDRCGAQSEADVEMPSDLELAPRFFADIAIDRSSEHVPRKERDDKNEHKEQRENHSQRL